MVHTIQMVYCASTQNIAHSDSWPAASCSSPRAYYYCSCYCCCYILIYCKVIRFYLLTSTSISPSSVSVLQHIEKQPLFDELLFWLRDTLWTIKRTSNQNKQQFIQIILTFFWTNWQGYFSSLGGVLLDCNKVNDKYSNNIWNSIPSKESGK